MKTIQTLLATLLLVLTAMLGSVNAAELQAGKDYRLLEAALPSENPGKIEVIEFFSYGCGHCAQFHPMLKRWTEQLPANVVLRRIPVAWNRTFADMARTYYALEITGDLARLDDEVFSAIHKDGERLDMPRARDEWLGKKGVNVQKFNDAYNSFSMQSKLRQGDQTLRASGLDGVPALVVNGQYVVLPDKHDEKLKVADALIAKLRSNKGKK